MNEEREEVGRENGVLVSTPTGPTASTVEYTANSGARYRRTDYFSDDSNAVQVYHIEALESPVTIRPHFHTVDQFQFFDRGPFKLGRHVLSTGAIQYVDAWKPYGPIISMSDNGLSFFVIREKQEFGAKYMPDSMGHLRSRPPGRARLRQLVGSAKDASAESSVVALLPDQRDGVSAELVILAPGQSIDDVKHPQGSAAVFLVLGGGLLRRKGDTWGEYSCMARRAGVDETWDAAAGPLGARLLYCSFADGRTSYRT